MRARGRRGVLLAVAALVAISATGGPNDLPERAAPPLPRDPARWIGAPQSWDALRGRVTLVFVWTFG
jgi:hypothetical protein